MKIGIALGSGGSKGAYQVGFFQAIKEMKMPYQVITGASIGAINGAIMVTQDLPLLENLWHNMELKKIMKYGINLDLDEILKSDKAELLRFIASYIKNRGINISPFKELIAKYLDVDKILASPIEFGITVATHPKLVGKDIVVKQYPKEKIPEYLLASASCFPAFPVTKIDGESYIDGAYYDRLPIDLAWELGAQHVIAVDLNNQRYSHPEYLDHAKVTYIRSYHDLGPFMLIKPEVLARNIRLGYLDTMKKFEKYAGYKYTFEIKDKLDDAAKRTIDSIDGIKHPEVLNFLTLKIREKMTARQRYLRFLEIIAEAADVDPLKIFDAPRLRREIEQSIEGNKQYVNWIAKRPAEQQFRLQNMREATRLGMVRQMAEEKQVLRADTQQMLAEHFPHLYLTAVYFGLIH